MFEGPFQPRRLLAALVFIVALSGLASCGRKDKVFNPQISGPVTWTNTVQHLFADRSSGTAPTGCTSCHHAGTGIPDWSDYATVYSFRTSIRSRLGTTGNMRQFLRPGEPDVVISWIDAGAPE